MLTLTYPAEFPADGELVKRQWAAMRMWLVARGIGGLWFLEFQLRGAPHYHVLMTGRVDKNAVRSEWARCIGYRGPYTLRTRVEMLKSGHAAAAYVSKYAAKAYQKQVPDGYENVGRLWGCFGHARVSREVVWEGTLEGAAPAVRVVKQAAKAARRLWSKFPSRRHDNGLRTFTAYDAALALRVYLARSALPAT